jgi:plasmid stabilization system protein ParE
MAQVTLLWSDRAITDLEQIADFIALDSPAGATSFVTKVVEAVSTLQAFPEAGRVVPEYGESSLRELIFRNYRIVYRKDEQSVTIVTVFHGSRSL